MRGIPYNYNSACHYRKVNGEYANIADIASMFDARFEDRSKGYANRILLEIRGHKPYQIENRLKLRGWLKDPEFCSDGVADHMMTVLDIFAREAACRISKYRQTNKG